MIKGATTDTHSFIQFIYLNYATDEIDSEAYLATHSVLYVTPEVELFIREASCCIHDEIAANKR